MEQEDTLRTYSGSSFAVRRWLAMHDGVRVEPKSFCQFWRGVLLWCTLMKLPFIGGLFVAERERTVVVEVGPPPDWIMFVGSFAEKLGRFFWTCSRWSIGLPVRGLWILFEEVAGFCSDHKKELGFLGDCLLLLFMAACVATIIGGLSWGIYSIITVVLSLPHSTNIILLPSVLGIVVLVALAVIYSDPVARTVVSVGDFVSFCAVKVVRFVTFIPRQIFWFLLDAAHLAFDIALSGKKKICPPMKIEW